MRVLVLGGGGMLGHKMVQALSATYPDTWWTQRGARRVSILPAERSIEGVDAADWPAVVALLRRMKPKVIVNCVGVIKQRDEAVSPIPSIAINSLLPHRLAESVGEWGGSVIHFSTDCVFSGRRGHYTEADQSDAEDLYGRSKFLGEVAGQNALTLRTSIIGRELEHHQSLLDWFLLGGHVKVKGFRRVWWSGVTTNHLASLVTSLISRVPMLDGLYQVSSGRISKYELLSRVRDAFGLQTEIEPDDEPENDRSLDGAKFAAATGYVSPPWGEMIAELVRDRTPYSHQPLRHVE